jgi:peptidoglycan hydrolase CwlO-like protein
MTGQLKNLLRLKNQAEPIPLETKPVDQSMALTTSDLEESRKRTYHETGYRDGNRNSGSPQALSISFKAIYAKFQNEEKELVGKQASIKEPYVNEQRNKETELKALAVTKENKEEQIGRIDGQIRGVKDIIENLKFEINDLARDPKKYHIDAIKGASSKFWIGLVILFFISLYLFTFYISTSYSAFFKTFDPDSNVLMNVLDPKAFEVAWKDGALEGAFVTLIPFVFIGLGYLIHMFGEEKSLANYAKVGLLLFITFVFDAILAYQIEDKIYELSKTMDSPLFDLSIAFTKIQFWGIIFAGFVVYIIWGLVFDFIMKEHKERDKIKHEQELRNKNIKIHQERIADLEKTKEVAIGELNQIKETIAKALGRINELQRIIDAVIIPTKEYVLYASEYMQGWITFINEKLFISRTETENLVGSCIDSYNAHCESVGAKEDSQNSIYLSTI